MSLYATISCPNCQRDLRVRSAYFGLNVNCKRCGHPFTVRPEDAREPIPDLSTPPRSEAEVRLEQENLQFRERWADAEDLAEDLFQKLRESDSVRVRLTVQVTEIQAELGAVQERLTEAERARDELATARGEIDRLRADLDSKSRDPQAESAQREAELQSRRDEAAALRSEIQEHERVASAREEEWTKALADESSRAAGLQEELRRVQERLAEQDEAHRRERETACSERDQLRPALAALEARSAEADRLTDELRSERDESGRLRIHVEEARQTERRNAELLAELDRLQTRLRDAESVDEDLKIARAELDRLGADLSPLRDRAAEADRLAELLRLEHDETMKLKTEFAQIHDADARSASALAAELDEARTLRDRLESDLREFREHAETHASDIVRHKEQIKSLLNEKEGERAAREQLELEVDRLRAVGEGREATAERLARVSVELAAARDECDRLRSEIEAQAARQTETNLLAEELALSRRVQADLVRQLGALQIEKDRRRHEHGSLTGFPDRPSLESDAGAETLRTELEEWLARAQGRRSTLLSLARDLDDQIHAAREDLAAVHRDLVLGQWGSEDDDGEEFPFG